MAFPNPIPTDQAHDSGASESVSGLIVCLVLVTD